MASKGQITIIAFDCLRTGAVSAAKQLLGSLLVANINDKPVRLRIVETEAYDQSDAASHSFKGKTLRTEVMFGPAGFLYVYFTYGMHYCCNVVVGEVGYGAAVLIRAVEPLDIDSILSERRGGRSGIEMTNGPAKLCQALSITTAMNGHNLANPPLKLLMSSRLNDNEILKARRVGIKKSKDSLWRFYIRDNPYVSVH